MLAAVASLDGANSAVVHLWNEALAILCPILTDNTGAFLSSASDCGGLWPDKSKLTNILLSG